MALETLEDDPMALVRHEAFLCLFVPNTNSKRWFYAITLEPLFPGQKLAIVLDLSNERKAIKANELKKAVDRLTVRKAFAESIYIKQFVAEGIGNRLLALRMIWRKDLEWDTMVADFDAIKAAFNQQASVAKVRRDKQALVTVDAACGVTTQAITPGRGKWKMKTPVATNICIGDALGEKMAQSTDALGRVVVQWTIGRLTKYHGLSSTPYEVQWDTQPHPLIVRKTEEDFKVLVDHYAYCKTYKLLGGYVGNDLLWERTDRQGTRLQYGYVLPFDPPTNKYKVAYRDGICGFKSEVDLKEAMKFTEEIIKGLHNKYTFNDAATAMQERLVTPIKIPESQPPGTTSEGTLYDGGDWNELWKTVLPDETPNVTFSVGAKSHPVEEPPRKKYKKTSTRRGNQLCLTDTAREDTLKPRNSRQEYEKKRAAQNAGSRWNVGRTKVATTTGNNPKYPNLKTTRTGWVAGMLTGFTEGDTKPYTIEWDTYPKQVSHVDTQEMIILRRDFSGSDKRRLLDMVCVGSEVLVPRDIKGQKIGAELKYATVMFYDLKIKGYKVLCRDGHEQWVDPEYLDELTANTREKNVECRRTAAAESWHPGIIKKIEGYGRYCVREFGADVNAYVEDDVDDTDEDDVDDTELPDPALLPRKKSQESTTLPGNANNLSSVDEGLPLLATGQLVCFLLESEETSKPKKTYGILATNVRLESKFGTCLMATNKYQTFAAQDIGDAAKRWEIPFFGDGSPKSTLELLHKVSYNDTDVRNKAIKESEELYLSAIAHTAKVNAEVTPEENVSNPTRQYTKDDKILRKRTYPCSFCKEPADGVHQCGYCYCHLHASCSPPFPGTEEGYGQLRICRECSTANTHEDDQVSFDNNDETDVNNNEVPSVEETTTKEEDGKLTALDASTEKTDPKENNQKEDEHNAYHGDTDPKENNGKEDEHNASHADTDPKENNAKLYGNESVASAV